MDESNINDEYNTKEEPNVTKEILFDVSDSETDNVTVSQMQVDPDEDEATDCRYIESYSLRLPTLAQLMAQSELEQGTSSGDQTKAERIKKKGSAKVVLNSPLDTRHQTIERERQHKENEIAKTLYGYYGNGTSALLTL